MWLAFDPVSRLIVAFVVGKHNQENANLLLDRVKDVTDTHVPFVTSDQLPEYDDALLHTYGVLVQPERNGTRGPYPLPRLMPADDLLYAQAYHHFVLPHHSLRQRLDTPEPTRGTGTPKKWKPVTPAMSAGITDHVWTTADLLSYRVPAQFLDQLPIKKPLFALLDDEVHQGK